MKHHGTVIMFILLFGLGPAVFGARIYPNIDCEKFMDVDGFVCEDTKILATQIMYVIITISIVISLAFAVDYFRIRDKVTEIEYFKQAIGEKK